MTNLKDYRNCKYLTKAQLNTILGACGKTKHENLKTVSKDTLIEEVKVAQEQTIARLGKLYEGEF